MHSTSYFADTFGEENERSGRLSGAMEMIAEERAGVIVVSNRRMSDSLTRYMKARGQAAGELEVEALRDYGGGAQILAEPGVEEMVLLTNTPHALSGIKGYSLSIVAERAIPGTGTA